MRGCMLNRAGACTLHRCGCPGNEAIDCNIEQACRAPWVMHGQLLFYALLMGPQLVSNDPILFRAEKGQRLNKGPTQAKRLMYKDPGPPGEHEDLT